MVGTVTCHNIKYQENDLSDFHLHFVFPNFYPGSLLACICNQSGQKAVWILIRRLCQKPADLDLQPFKKKKRINSGTTGQELIVIYVNLCL